MTTTPDVLHLIQFIADAESRGMPAVNCEDVFPAQVIRHAEQQKLISVSIGSWADDGQFCSLRNAGRQAIGLPTRPTIWDRIRSRLMPKRVTS